MTDDTPVVVDTSVVSYIFNRHPVTAYYLNEFRGRPLAVSFQTVEEIWFGAWKNGWGRRRRTRWSFTCSSTGLCGPILPSSLSRRVCAISVSELAAR